MRRRKLVGLLIVGMLRVTIATVATAQEAVAKPSLAIADVAVAPGGWTLPPPQLSSAIIELMMNELVSSEKFHVYDGQWLVPEQEAGRANLERLRAVAADRHVDYVVLGSLNGFSAEQKKKRLGGVLPTPIFLGGFSRQQQELRVSMTFRIVDVRSGEVVATASGDGLGTRRGTSLGGGGIVHGLPLGLIAGVARAAAPRDAMLDEAVKQAVQRAALALAQSASRLNPPRNR
jgi:curli biogenesis system outer membrane secretion channel CsgG